MEIPADTFILLSLVNTKLRDFYPSLEELCAAEGIDESTVVERLAFIGYTYDATLNKFI